MVGQSIINIALSGDVGTGTTTLGRNMASTLGWRHVNAGDYFRQWHQQYGVALENTQDVPEEVDRQLDDSFGQDLKQQHQTVFESHLAGWLARDNAHSFRILCQADRDVAMARIATREGWSLDYATEYSIIRTHRLNEKFRRLYGVSDAYDAAMFHLVIDTTNMSAGQVLDEALSQFLRWLPNGHALAHVLHLPD